MKKQLTYITCANAALKITLFVAALTSSTIWLTGATPITPKASGQGTAKPHSQTRIAAPILGQYPDASLPLSTNTTVTPDTAPVGAAMITIATSTDFNGTFAADPTTGVVRVTNAHPAGSYLVTVTAFDSGGGTTAKTFALTVSTLPICPQLSFEPAVTYDIENSPVSMGVGDFNGDGNQDVAVGNSGVVSAVSIFLGDGTGNFSAPTKVIVDYLPFGVAVGDFNGDGKQDLAVAVAGNPGNVSILLGDGTGNFTPAIKFILGVDPSSVAVGDFNGDGRQDLAVAHEHSFYVSILLGDGTGNFSAPTNVTLGSGASSIVVSDFNGDGKQDLAVSNDNLNTVEILLGDGTGSFGPFTKFSAGSGANDIALGDFNGDGRCDLAVANFLAKNVSVLLGDGNGSFSAPTNFHIGPNPVSVVTGDFNSDGRQDLAVTAYNDSVSILLGDGTGAFSAPTGITVGLEPAPVVVGDFNHDGRQDLAVGVYLSGEMSILIRNCPAMTATLLSAASRLTHGSAGSFDINVPLTGTSGVEDRSAGSYNAVFTFDMPVTSGDITVLSGTATVGAIGFAGNEMTAALTGVTDVQTVVLHLSNINGGGGTTDVPFGFLAGDVDGNRTVAKPDGNQIQTDKGQVVSASNFRDDINLSGVVDKSDFNSVKTNKGHILP